MYCYTTAITVLASIQRSCSINLSISSLLRNCFGSSNKGLSTRATCSLYADHHRLCSITSRWTDDHPTLLHHYPQIPQETKLGSLRK